MRRYVSAFCLAFLLCVEIESQQVAPGADLIPPTEDWSFNETWLPVTKGNRAFHYMTHYSTYWGRPWEDALRQNGMLDEVTRGMLVDLEIFSAAERAKSQKLADGFEQWKRLWLGNNWPFYSYARDPYLYDAQHSREQVEPAAYEADLSAREDILQGLREHAGDLWLGSWLGENAERAAMIVLDDGRKRALGQKNRGLRFPVHIEKHFEGIYNPERQWTKQELHELVRLVCDVRSASVGGLVATGAGPLIQAQASEDRCLSILQKNPKPIQIASARGAARCTGKYWGIACHHMQMGYSPICLRRFDPCYPIDSLRRWFLSGYFSGCGYTSIERFPDSMFRDYDGDGYWELTDIGKLFRELFDLRRRHPDRGIPYTPVALLEDWDTCRYYYRTGVPGHTYRYFVPYTEEDHLAWGLLLTHLLPIPRDFPTYAGMDRGTYSDLEGADTPYGELFDIIRPNPPDGPLPLKVLANYRVLFCMDRVEWKPAHVQRLVQYVEDGGTLVVNTRQLTQDFAPEFLGVTLTGATFEEKAAISRLDDAPRFAGESFVADEVALQGAEAVLVTPTGKPLVTRHARGKGQVIVTTPHFLLEKATRETFTGRERLDLRPLVCFAPYLLKKLTERLLPIQVEAEAEASLRYSYLRKGKGWVVVLMSNSFARDFSVATVRSGWFLDAGHAPRQFPVKLICRVPVADALEWTEDRDVQRTRDGGKTVLQLRLPAGAVRVIEIQPEPIELAPDERPTNLALNCPAQASSSAVGHVPKFAFDGRVSQTNGWWSATGRNRYDMPLPQWLSVDLGAAKPISAVRIWPAWSTSPATKNRFYRYVIEGSIDGETWQLLVDESRNVDPAEPDGLIRWFEPTETRHVRVTIDYCATNEGAMISELEVYGDEMHTTRRERKLPQPGVIPFPP